MPEYHASIGGSNIERVMLCPGSVRLNATLKQESSRAAARGTMLHAAMEQIITHGKTPEELLAVKFTVEGVTLEQADARVALMKAHRAFKTFTKDATVQIEQKVRYVQDVWGTADILGENKTHNLVGDFKFGTGIVEAQDNKQMLFYVGGAIESNLLPMRKTRMAVIQPGKTTLSTAFATMKQIKAFIKDVRRVAGIAFGDKAPFNPSETACKWCRAKVVCPAQGAGLLRAKMKAIDFNRVRL